jgi:hypothetical protein
VMGRSGSYSWPSSLHVSAFPALLASAGNIDRLRAVVANLRTGTSNNQVHPARNRSDAAASLPTRGLSHPQGRVKVELPTGRTTLTPFWGCGTPAVRA